MSLQNKTNLTQGDEKLLDFFRQRGAIYLTTYAVAKCLESIIGRAIPNLFRVSFGNQCSPSQARNNWKEVLEVIVPFLEHLKPAVEKGLTNMVEIDKAVDTFRTLITSIRKAHTSRFDDFKDKISPP